MVDRKEIEGISCRERGAARKDLWEADMGTVSRSSSRRVLGKDKGDWVEMRRAGDGYKGRWRSRDPERNDNCFTILPGTDRNP